MSRIKVYKHDVFVARKTNRYPITQCGIIYVSCGQVTYQTKAQEPRILKAGEFTIYHSDRLDHLESHCDAGQFCAEIVTFEPSLLRQFCDKLEPSTTIVNQHELQHFSLTEQHYTAQKILALLLHAKKTETSSETTLESLAQALLSEVVSIEPGFLPIIESACNQRTAEKVIAFIEINIENDVSLESTAHFLGMSIATLKRRLAAENLSFSQILKIKRVNYAATKLRLSNKSIAEIATESGFKSAAHFSTAFKGVQGMTPKEFRQHVKP
ncbi:AraC family transcriptional regulator [Vibrio sp. TH_r3]|uniref:AraC family transcriptional regulator n=1 Tax=Vibrio sp. TH_r3 TaxID=3082084 RepID=UPI002952B878|nr:AraC family transcriptional regulator [Vibrio sp. TH_r3]MDV7103568.1 AraC family transcriptional regulator [Vibrio sp. TH_r3]